MGLLFLLLSVVSAASGDKCREPFELDVNLLYGHVTWKGRTFYAPVGEINLVHLLTSRQTVWEYDELIVKYYGRSNENLVDARASIKQIAHNVRKRFRQIDPDFKQIQTIRKVGLYWRNYQAVEMYHRGVLSVSKLFFLAYVKFDPVQLTEAEHYILSRLIRTPQIRRGAFLQLKPASEPVLVSMINRKFKPLIGDRRLIISSGDAWILKAD